MNFADGLLEATVMLCFSTSWVFSIMKSARSKSTGGKSILFLWIIFTGYLAGVLHKVLINYDWVIYCYILNLVMVFIDLMLYYRNRGIERLAALNK